MKSGIVLKHSFFSQPQAVHLQVNPLLFIVPVTIAISFAFILPISSVNDKIFFLFTI